MTRAALPAVVVVLLWLAPAAGAQERAFTLLGSEPYPKDSGPPSLPRAGTDVASDLSRPFVADVAALPGGGVAVLGGSGTVDVIGLDGRLRTLGRVSAEPTAIDGAADGAVLVLANRLWRFGPDGGRTALTPLESLEYSVLAMAALPDNSVVYAERRPGTGVRFVRVAPDGSRQPLAGNGQTGELRAGPATQSPIPQELQLDASPNGEILIAAGEEGAWMISADGQLRALGGAGRVGRGRGAPADGTQFASAGFVSVDDLSGDPAGELVLLSGDGRLWTARQNRVFRRTSGASVPVWAGLRSRSVSLDTPLRVDLAENGDVLVTTGDGVGLLTRPRADAVHLAVAITVRTLATVRRGRVSVAASRSARAELQVVRRGRVMQRVRRQIRAGVTTLTLPERLPPGTVRLRIRAVDTRGAVATHRLSVLGTRRVPVPVARRVLLNVGDDFATSAQVRRCRRRRMTRVDCDLTIGSEDGRTRYRATVTLRADGWLWVRIRNTSARVQLF